jgi:tRNA/tmRNA/rRNA uracil-C5-methylase (TrmA/RlmC/RlmD family)
LNERAEVAELEVERIGARGDGIARWRGQPVYLPFTLPGERVRARLGLRRPDESPVHPLAAQDELRRICPSRTFVPAELTR